MEQEATNNKEKKQDILKEKDNSFFMEIDKHSDPISNFLSNLIRQFKKTKGMDLGKLFIGKSKNFQKPLSNPSDIIGFTKTVFRTNYNTSKEEESTQSNKKTGLKITNSLSAEQDNSLNPKKPKFRL